jgi:hypothetical protein
VKDKKFSSAKKTQTGFTGVVTLRLWIDGATRPFLWGENQLYPYLSS